jgi:hypothetical protein
MLMLMLMKSLMLKLAIINAGPFDKINCGQAY